MRRTASNDNTLALADSLISFYRHVRLQAFIL
jgi:hypothetical protein